MKRVTFLSLVLGNGLLAATSTTTQSLTATVTAVAKISTSSTTTLSTSGGAFQLFTGSSVIQFRVRTSAAGGGSIQFTPSTDFSSGCPSIATGHLSYFCTDGTYGSACSSGSSTMPFATSSTLLTFPASACTGGGGACSSGDPNSVRLNFTLSNLPEFLTGACSAPLQFASSAF